MYQLTSMGPLCVRLRADLLSRQMGYEHFFFISNSLVHLIWQHSFLVLDTKNLMFLTTKWKCWHILLEYVLLNHRAKTRVWGLCTLGSRPLVWSVRNQGKSLSFHFIFLSQEA